MLRTIQQATITKDGLCSRFGLSDQRSFTGQLERCELCGHRKAVNTDSAMPVHFPEGSGQLPEIRERVSSVALSKAMNGSRETSEAPSEDALFFLLEDIEQGRKKFPVIERVADTTRQTYIQSIRNDAGEFVVNSATVAQSSTSAPSL